MTDWGILRESGNDFLSSLSPFHQDANYSYRNMMSSLIDRTYASSPLYDENTFCSPDNIDQCILHLNQELSSLGLKPLSLDGVTRTTSLVNTVHEILSMYQKTSRTKDELENRIHRLSSDVTENQSAVRRLKQERERLERDCAQEKENHRQLHTKHKTLAVKFKTEKDECRRQLSVIKDRDAQYKHELKKKQREINKLMERLHQLLMDKNPERRIGMDMAGLVQRGDNKRGTWKKTANNSKKEEMYQVLITNYEEKQQELRVENNELRNCLAGMQKELSSVLNRPDSSTSHTKSIPLSQTEFLSRSSSDTDLSTISTVSQNGVNGITEGHYQLPYDLMRENVQRNFQDLCRQIKESIKKSPHQTPSNGRSSRRKGSPSKSPGRPAEERRSAGRNLEDVDKLCKQIEKYKEIVKQQEDLIQQSLHSKSRSMETSFFHESQVLHEKEGMAEERQHLYKEKSKFEEEKRKLTESLIQLRRERQQLEEEKTNMLKNEFLKMTPFSKQQSSPRSMTSSSKCEKTRLLPSTPVFSPAPSKKVKTPSTAELYRMLGITPKSSGKSNAGSRRKLPQKSGSTESIISSCKSAPTDLTQYSSASAKRLSFDNMEEIENSLFRSRRRSSTGSLNSLDDQC